ncbi:hypothetical protein NY2A_b622L [Paramecium bursaria Chlorella virus NY2A]|uniref:Uncharacterized protein b622L n=1 Tax=Paramecium bursaria Chlorella virus NY2A TaxID=46021 RepID=A7IXE7_PBCVN|nr:hypothetical protein NY2A_b622L [Paramecium bursaria Chlorella virus NY2A]ABT15021.1 hypothetical protein NY2A_b622L [Paramecium bursaria Chlorella virus NY2A]
MLTRRFQVRSTRTCDDERHAYETANCRCVRGSVRKVWYQILGRSNTRLLWSKRSHGIHSRIVSEIVKTKRLEYVLKIIFD